MKRAVTFLALILVFAGLGLSVVNGSPAVRILALGDSIVEGFPGAGSTIEGGFRTRLYNLLVGAGYTVDLVGTHNGYSNNSSLPDPDHEGHGGFEISPIDAGIEGWFSAVDEPDVILLLIGTNDFAGNNDITHAKDRLETLIAHIASLRPYARIIVSNLLKRTDTPPLNPNADDDIQSFFNPFVPSIVDHQVSLGRLVSFVDLHDCFAACCGNDPAIYLGDGLHPSATGYNAMGDAWFNAITNVITPEGTPTNAPVIVKVSGQVDLKHVVVTFSKPMEDAAAVIGNFSLSGGLSISGVELDANTKRTITLTTSQQALSTGYTVTVNGVRDRTTQHNTIGANSSGSFQSKSIAEAAGYSLVYSLKVPNQADFNSRGVPYAVDKHASIGSFSRIAYYLELQSNGGGLQYLWVSMDAFTSDASKIGIPTVQSGVFFQQGVGNMNVQSSVVGSASGVGGNVEFWPGDYGPGNDGNVVGASGGVFDFGDGAAPGEAGYGSMQVHRTGTGQTLFAFNGWGGAGLVSDLGIGNATGANTDWTFAQNAAGYTNKVLQVYVLPGSGTPNTPVITGQPSNLSASVGSSASFNVSASGPGTLAYQWRFNGAPIVGATGSGYTINGVQAGNGGSYDVVVTNTFGATTSSAAVLTVVQAGVLANGSFESDYVGWMGAGNQEITTTAGRSSDGAKSVIFNNGNTTPNGILSQSFASISGQTYTLSFDLGVLAFNANPQKMAVSVEGNRQLDTRTIILSGVVGGPVAWLSTNYSFVADSATTTIVFQDQSATTLGVDLLLDNLRVTAQSPVLRVLTVNSVNPGSAIAVTVSPDDQNGAGGGSSPLSRTYANGTVVTLTAPASASGTPFVKWQTNGVDRANTTSISLTMNATYTATAVYADSRALIVNSVNPGNNVVITVSPNDQNGASDGPTPLSRAYDDGTLVTVSAPATASGNTFLKWQTNGVDAATTTDLTFAINASYDLSAVYQSTVLGAYVFYNNSAWDGNNSGANSADDNAIATDKTPLRPGQTATFANYTSYSRGVNGIMVDISSLPGTPSLTDFTFKVGNDSNPEGWPNAPAPSASARRAGAGINGSDRFTLIWQDSVIIGKWLQVTVLATPETGLATPYVFYFGNAPAETGNSLVNAWVTGADVLQVYNHIAPSVPVTAIQDFNRDKRVTGADVLIAYNNLIAGQNALQLISPNSAGLLGADRPRSAGSQSAQATTLSGAQDQPAPVYSLPVSGKISGGQLSLSFGSGQLAPQSVVQWSSDLTDSEWIDLAPEWIAVHENGTFEIKIPLEQAGSHGFFRFDRGAEMR